MTAGSFDGPVQGSAPGRVHADARKFIGSWLLGSWAGLYFPALVLAVWWIAADRHWMASTILPAPSVVAGSLYAMVVSGELADNLAVSLARVAAGFVVGGALGLALGLAMGLSRTVDAWISPLFRAIAQIPSLAWIPLLMMGLGIGETLKFVVLAKACLVPVAITTAAGIRNISADYLEVGRVFRLSRRTMLIRIVLPGAAPSIFSGFRQGLAHVWTTLIIVEMMASANGVGYLMSWARTLFQLDVVMACIVVVGVIGFCLDVGLKRVEARLLAWRG